MTLELTVSPAEDGRPETLADPGALSRLPAGIPFWLDVTDPADGEVEAVAGRFGLHGLVVEGVCRGGRRPKFEEYPEYGFLVFLPHPVASQGGRP